MEQTRMYETCPHDYAIGALKIEALAIFAIVTC